MRNINLSNVDTKTDVPGSKIYCRDSFEPKTGQDRGKAGNSPPTPLFKRPGSWHARGVTIEFSRRPHAVRLVDHGL